MKDNGFRDFVTVFMCMVVFTYGTRETSQYWMTHNTPSMIMIFMLIFYIGGKIIVGIAGLIKSGRKSKVFEEPALYLGWVVFLLILCRFLSGH